MTPTPRPRKSVSLVSGELVQLYVLTKTVKSNMYAHGLDPSIIKKLFRTLLVFYDNTFFFENFEHSFSDCKTEPTLAN